MVNTGFLQIGFAVVVLSWIHALLFQPVHYFEQPQARRAFDRSQPCHNGVESGCISVISKRKQGRLGNSWLALDFRRGYSVGGRRAYNKQKTADAILLAKACGSH
jgi:hypothetical protein